MVRIQETEELLVGEDIVRYVKVQTIRWFGRLQMKTLEKMVRRITDWRPMRETERKAQHKMGGGPGIRYVRYTRRTDKV